MNKEIQKLLSSSKAEDLDKGLSLFEKKGSIKELPLVCKLLDDSCPVELENKIVELLSNIKVSEANSIIIDAINNNKKANLRAFMQICWQSQLNFTQNLALFTDIFIKGDYLTALEAFTVIENIWLDYSFEEEHQELLTDMLKDSLSNLDENKLILTKELIQVLEG